MKKKTFKKQLEEIVDHSSIDLHFEGFECATYRGGVCDCGTEEKISKIQQLVLEMIGEPDGYSVETPTNSEYWQEQNEHIKLINEFKASLRSKLLED